MLMTKDLGQDEDYVWHPGSVVTSLEYKSLISSGQSHLTPSSTSDDTAMPCQMCRLDCRIFPARISAL
jgi:hypothetical protein